MTWRLQLDVYFGSAVVSALYYLRQAHMRTMLKQKLNWKRPLFYVLLPIFFVTAFLGFPLPVAPPPATKPAQEQTVVVKKKKKRVGLVLDDTDRRDGNG